MFKFSLTNTAILLIISILSLSLSSCKPADGQTAAPGEEGTGELAGMILEDIPGSDVKYARRLDPGGNVHIEGFVENDRKTGQWIEYTSEGDIALINHFVNGMLEGTSMRMSFRNQVDLRLNYRQNKMHGSWTAYKFGKVVETRSYKEDKLDGTARTYDDRTFKLKQEVEYKDGKQDGFFKYYDEEGKVTLEYEYKNGEKVSGGMVEPPK